MEQKIKVEISLKFSDEDMGVNGEVKFVNTDGWTEAVGLGIAQCVAYQIPRPLATLAQAICDLDDSGATNIANYVSPQFKTDIALIELARKLVSDWSEYDKLSLYERTQIHKSNNDRKKG